MNHFHDLANRRLEQAVESLKSAELLASQSLLQGALNRAYYSMFYAVQALMLLKGTETSKHRGVLSFFDIEFIKTGYLPKTFSFWFHQTFRLRQKSDYELDFIPERDQAEEAIAHAREFLAGIQSLLAQQVKDS